MTPLENQLGIFRGKKLGWLKICRELQMPRPAPSVCLLCKFTSSRRIFHNPLLSRWQSSRSAAQLQRRRPQRMSLSPNVSRSPTRFTPKSRARPEEGDSPFGGMNLRSAKIQKTPRARSAAELKRSTQGKETQKKERDTFHALKMQRSLSEISYDRRNAIRTKIEDLDTFDAFGLLPTVESAVATEALPGLTDIVPTPIQRRAIPVLLENRQNATGSNHSLSNQNNMNQFLLAAETGSGKTLAYLLPVLNAIKEAEKAQAEDEARQRSEQEQENVSPSFHEVQPPALTTAPHSTTARPKAIILLPTSELVTQVGAVAKKLSHTVKFRSALISSAYSSKIIHSRLFAPSGIDLLISTPHLVASISDSDPYILSRVTHLIVDEADSLFDKSFAPSTTKIIDKSTPSLKQLILCSATIPRSLDSYLRNRFPDMKRLVTPNLHAIPRRVQLGVIDVDKPPYQGNKMLACADTIWSIAKSGRENFSSLEDREMRRMLVFVNERETSQQVANYLVSKGIDAVALNRDLPEQRQSETLQAFTSRHFDPAVARSGQQYAADEDAPKTRPAKASSAARPAPPRAGRRQLPNTKVLVATDLGSRGIDTLAVKYVILYDVPHTTIDFIHRLGRTGRMGQRGRGIVLVNKHDRKDVVREVREGMFKGQALI